MYSRSSVFRAMNGFFFGAFIAAVVIVFLVYIKQSLQSAPSVIATPALLLIELASFTTLCFPGFLYFWRGLQKPSHEHAEPGLLSLLVAWLFITIPIILLLGSSCWSAATAFPCDSFIMPWRETLAAVLGPLLVLYQKLKAAANRKPHTP